MEQIQDVREQQAIDASNVETVNGLCAYSNMFNFC